LNPQICNECEQFAARYQGGAEIELSLLFADVRGSTGLAEKMSPSAFSDLINRFYRASTGVLFRSNALVEKLIGDGVTAFFVPGIAGSDHAEVAITAAQSILRATGHENPDGPWIPVGVGVHTGVAFVGAVASEDGVVDITALGDAVNTAARLASEAQRGEIVVSEETISAASSRHNDVASRQLQLKGRAQPVKVKVLEVKPRYHG
jgi:adenylate cyclase